jgi:hypothetical protein
VTAADAHFPTPWPWPVREYPEDPHLRVAPYQPPSVPAVAPPRVLTETQIVAMVRADEAEEAHRRRVTARAHALESVIIGAHVAAVAPTRRARVPLWTRFIRWLAR